MEGLTGSFFEEVIINQTSQETRENKEYLRKYLESKTVIESINAVNLVLERLRQRGSYGGKYLTKTKFEVKPFPDMIYGQGACLPTNERIILRPSSTTNPRKMVHEGLHFASNWRFIKNNKMAKKDIYRSGFSSTRAFDDAQSVYGSSGAYCRLNEGFTDYFAKRFSETLRDETEAHKQEMILLCKKQFDEAIAKRPTEIDFLTTAKNRMLEMLTLSDAEVKEPYSTEVAFVEDYLFRKAFKRIKALGISNEKKLTEKVREDVIAEALDAYINGDVSFLSDIDELFGSGASEKIRMAKSGHDLLM